MGNEQNSIKKIYLLRLSNNLFLQKGSQLRALKNFLEIENALTPYSRWQKSF